MNKLSLLLQRDIYIDPEVQRLIELESCTPVIICEDSSLRIKVTDSCGMACTFCHNEGTPVTLTNQRDINGRVSIYEDRNGVSFVSKPFEVSSEFSNALDLLSEELNSNEIHWTGGEPTLNPNIALLTKHAVDKGYKVKMTSNGETGSMRMKSLADAGLESINFSIFGTTPEEIAQVQSDRFKNYRYGQAKLKKLGEAIDSAIKHGIKVKANVVVQNQLDFDRVYRVINRFGNKVELRLLPNLADRDNSMVAIYRLLLNLNARPVKRIISAGSSNIRTDFETPIGVVIGFKQINRITLPTSCSDCTLNNEEDCNEGYYGVRMYQDQLGEYNLGVCIQRMDMTIRMNTFIDSGIAKEIRDFRKSEYQRLVNEYADYFIE